MENTSASINLVKKKETSAFDKFIDWALSIGRLIVILTEIITIAAFIYRFSLDEKLSQLHEDIKQKQNHLSLLKIDEQNFRNLHDRIELVSNFSKANNKVYQIFHDIVNFTPEDLKYNDLNLKKNQITLDIDVSSTPSLTEFINSLKSYSYTKSVSIDNIENRPDVGLFVAITALFK